MTREPYPNKTPCDPQITAYQEEWAFTEERMLKDKGDRRREINMNDPEIVNEISKEKRMCENDNIQILEIVEDIVDENNLCVECGYYIKYRGGLCNRCWQEAHS